MSVGYLLRFPLFKAAGGFLVEDDRPQKADAVVVLGGDEFGNRIVKGAQLAAAGYAPYVLVSSPFKLLGHEADATIEYARRQGFPVSLFRPLNHELDSTRSEATLVDNYLRSHQVRKILLVTSNYHTGRAARLFRHDSPHLWVIPVAAPDPAFSPDRWWRTRAGQKIFLMEWLKTIATAFGV